MVKPQTIDAAIPDEPDQARMDSVEYLRILDLETDEVCDLEKASMGEHLASCAPVDQPPYLALVQRVQRRQVCRRLVQRPRKRSDQPARGLRKLGP